MSEKTIYDTLRAAGLSHNGACALMGNMMAESAMLSNNAQNGMTSLTDEEYTFQADNNMLDFVNDKVGYGLCQWTFWSRKAQLLTYCRNKGVSIADEQAQVEFCLQELKGEYYKVLKALLSESDLYTLTKLVCTDYERPAVNNVDVRYGYAMEFDSRLSGAAEQTTPPVGADPSVAVLQLVMNHNGYTTPVSGVKTAEFLNAFREFADDVINS